MIGDEAADIAEGRPAKLDRGDDGREVIIQQHQVGRLPGHVGAGGAHRHPDVGLPQRGAVVDAIAGHRHDVAAVLECPGNPQLVLGGHPGHYHPVGVEQGSQLTIIRGQVSAGQHDWIRASEANFRGNRPGGRRVVAGDHRQGDPGPPAGGDGAAYVQAGRIFQTDQAEQDEVLLGPVGQKYWNTLEQKAGIKVLDVWYLGTRELDLTKSVGPITTPAQLKGVKLRMPDSKAWLEVGRSLGANPTPLGFGEVYLGLKTGTIEGQDNPIPTDMTQKFFEVTHYLVLTNHMIGYTTPMINAKLWNSMPPKIQLDMKTAMQIARDYNNYQTLLTEQTALAKAEKEYGIQVVIPNQKAFMDHAKAYYSQPQFNKEWGDGVYAKIQALGR